jgi:hypothetical protein
MSNTKSVVNTAAKTTEVETPVVEVVEKETVQAEPVNTQPNFNGAIPKLMSLASEITGLNVIELVQVYGWVKQDNNLTVIIERLQKSSAWKDLWVGCPVQPKQELLVEGISGKLKELVEWSRAWIGDEAALWLIDKIDAVDLEAVKEDVAIGASMLANKANDTIIPKLQIEENLTEAVF